MSPLNFGRGLQLDFDTADRITILNLRDSYKYLKKESSEIQEEFDKTAEIPEHKNADLMYNLKMMKHIQAVLEYFGETVE